MQILNVKNTFYLGLCKKTNWKIFRRHCSRSEICTFVIIAEAEIHVLQMYNAVKIKH
jgi:hypothetical protein